MCQSQKFRASVGYIPTEDSLCLGDIPREASISHQEKHT